MQRILAIFLLLCCVSLAKSQPPGIVLPRAYTPYQRMYFPYNNGRVTPNTVIENNSRKYYFTVLFKDSTNLTRLAKIDEHKRDFYLAIDQPGMTRSIRPSETIEIARRAADGKIMTGIAADSCWLFKITEGKISLYSVLAEYKPRFVVAFQREGGPILPVTKDNVREAIKDDEELASKITEDSKLVPLLMKYNKKHPLPVDETTSPPEK